MSARAGRGFTLVEVLVALMIVALGLTALMSSVSGTARTSGFLRDKALAQWIALNRIAEVRLNLQTLGQNSDTGELDFANRRWHYDTRYFDTNTQAMRRVIVRVWIGDANTKGNPVAECSGFIPSAIATPGSSNAVYTTLGIGPVPPAAANGKTAVGTNGAANATGTGTAPPGTATTPGTVTTPAPLITPGTGGLGTPTP